MHKPVTRQLLPQGTCLGGIFAYSDSGPSQQNQVIRVELCMLAHCSHGRVVWFDITGASTAKCLPHEEELPITQHAAVTLTKRMTR